MNKTIMSWETQVETADWPGPVEAAMRRHAEGALGNRAALEGPEGALSFAELNLMGDALAAQLHALGVGPGAVVAVLAERRAALVPALLGIQRAGVVFSVIDRAYPPERIQAMLGAAQPAALIEIGTGRGPDYPCPRLSLPALRQIAGVAPAPAPMLGPDDPACLTFTSGTTGQPMAVLGRQSGLSAFLPWTQAAFDLGPEDTFSLLSGLSHDPLQRDIFTAWWVGARLAVPPADVFDLPGALGRWLAEAGVTVANLTPSMLRLLTLGGGAPLPKLRRVFVVGEALRAADVLGLRQIAPQADVINLYGATETQRALTTHRIAADELPADPIPLGRACPGMEVLVLREDGTPAAPGEIGAIWIKSRHLALGYLGQPEATEAAFQAEADGTRRYATGDLGQLRADGTLVFAGRRDRQVNIRGYRVELGDIEAAAEGLPDLASARALWAEERGQILLFAVPRAGAAPQMRDIRKALAARLPGYMQPARVILVAAFPLTPNGKLDERALRAAA